MNNYEQVSIFGIYMSGSVLLTCINLLLFCMGNQVVGIGLKSLSLSGSSRPGSSLGYAQSIGSMSRILAPIVVSSFESYEEPAMIAIYSVCGFVLISLFVGRNSLR